MINTYKYILRNVDSNVQRQSIPFVSKCECCEYPQLESLHHLFYEGEMGKYLWQYFGSLLQMPVLDDVFATIRTWFGVASFSSYRKMLIGLIPGFICWHIWRERCNRRFSSRTQKWSQIVLVIIADCNFIPLQIATQTNDYFIPQIIQKKYILYIKLYRKNY